MRKTYSTEHGGTILTAYLLGLIKTKFTEHFSILQNLFKISSLKYIYNVFNN